MLSGEDRLSSVGCLIILCACGGGSIITAALNDVGFYSDFAHVRQSLTSIIYEVGKYHDSLF